jgi:non-ribosomal peptide synthetase component F
MKTAQWQEYAWKQQVTLNTLMQAAWALVLSRYSGQADVVFGTVVAGRPPELAGVERMIGLFINTMPVRVQVRDEEEVGVWLTRLQKQQIEQRSYEYCPLVQVQGWSEIPREYPVGQAHRLLFESLLVFENYPVGSGLAPALAGLEVEVEAVQVVEQTNYPLTIIVGPGADRNRRSDPKGRPQPLHLQVSYDRQRFEPATIKRLLLHLQNCLQQLAADPRQQLAEVSLLTELEREQQLVQWNAIKSPSEPSWCLHQLIEQQVVRTPEAIAVVFDAVGSTSHLTYQQLNAQANQLAHRLLGEGIGPDVLVGVYMERSLR